MNTSQARQLAAQYQSPGAIGRTFAAFASGRRVSYERFIAETEMAATEIGFDAHEDMAALRAYAEETADNVWTDMDNGVYA